MNAFRLPRRRRRPLGWWFGDQPGRSAPLSKKPADWDRLHMGKRMILVLVGLLLLAGCGGGDDTEVSDPTAETTTSTTVATATPESVASAIVSPRQSSLDAIAAFEECSFPYECDTVIGAVLVLTLGTTTETLLITLDGMTGPDADAIIGGEIPDEMVSLVDRTTNAAEQLKVSTDDYDAQGCGVGGPAGACGQIELDMGFYASNLQTQLEGWEPYI